MNNNRNNSRRGDRAMQSFLGNLTAAPGADVLGHKFSHVLSQIALRHAWIQSSWWSGSPSSVFFPSSLSKDTQTFWGQDQLQHRAGTPVSWTVFCVQLHQHWYSLGDAISEMSCWLHFSTNTHNEWQLTLPKPGLGQHAFLWNTPKFLQVGFLSSKKCPKSSWQVSK